MLKFNTLLCVLVLSIIGLGLSACTTTTTPTESASTAGVPPTATAVSAATSQPAQTTPRPTDIPTLSKNIHLDPALATDADSLLVSSYVYDTLTRSQNGQPQPGIAESWIISDDKLDYVLRLRSDVVFQNGARLNADIVVANFNRWFYRDHPLHGDGAFDAWFDAFQGFSGDVDSEGRPTSSFDGIEKVDNVTVLIHLTRHDPNLLTNLSLPGFSIIDPALLTVHGDKFGTSIETTNGTGPYLITAWDSFVLTLQPNPNYWGDKATTDLVFELK